MNAQEQAYRKMEVYFLTPRCRASDTEPPRLVFVFASPGAGKSTLVKSRLNGQFAETGAVNLEIDELKTFIPAGQNVAKTADAWFLRLIDKAISERRSLLVFRQRNMLLPGQTRRLYQKAKAAGYVTQASFLALDKERSRLGMVHRYEFALENEVRTPELNRVNYPRRPDFLCHYIFYKALPVMQHACSFWKSVDVVDVYDRQGERLAWHDKRTGQGSPLTPSRAIRCERTRRWNIWEKNKFNRRRAEAETKMKEHGRGWFALLKFKLLTLTSKSR